MAVVHQRVLNWLYSVLTSEYKDMNRTYNDVAQTLSHYPSLSPRTDVYTYEDGASALFLLLSGTLPVTFRGVVYRFPISVWVPHSYPKESPLVYVTPAEGMAIRAGQHVDPQGKVYHPYLAGWAEFWDKSNILDFLEIIRNVFAKEPPVVFRQPQTVPLPSRASPIPPPLPPLPPGITRHPSATSVSTASPSTTQPRPPAPPPKTSESPELSQSSTLGTLGRRHSTPPLQPLPSRIRRHISQAQPPIPPYQNDQPERRGSLRYETAPPLPSQTTQGSHSSASPPIPQNRPQSYVQRPPGQHFPPPLDPKSLHMPDLQLSHWPQNLQQQPIRQQKPKPPPPPDIIDGPPAFPSPLDTDTALSAPPIPPNPEKDLILSNVAKALHAQRQHSLTQSQNSLPGLRSQHAAMLTALEKMQTEVRALESLNGMLVSNTNILHAALRDADTVIEGSQHRAPPEIDELLVAPTVVGNQLYELVSEERSIGDALFVLSRAVQRGRVSASVFAKTTRALAREWYLKKALVRKIGRGMGLIDERTTYRR